MYSDGYRKCVREVALYTSCRILFEATLTFRLDNNAIIGSKVKEGCPPLASGKIERQNLWVNDDSIMKSTKLTLTLIFPALSIDPSYS